MPRKGSKPFFFAVGVLLHLVRQAGTLAGEGTMMEHDGQPVVERAQAAGELVAIHAACEERELAAATVSIDGQVELVDRLLRAACEVRGASPRCSSSSGRASPTAAIAHRSGQRLRHFAAHQRRT